MRPGFLLQRKKKSDHGGDPGDIVSTHDQAPTESRNTWDNVDVNVIHSLDCQLGKELAWWMRLFCATSGDFRRADECSSIITRLLARKGFHREWKLEDLPLHLSLVSDHEARNLSHEQRVKSELARDRFSLFIWHGQSKAGLPFLSACDWCGQPTGAMCELCSQTWVCVQCQSIFEECRDCSD
jgi:hypothetical protein